MTDTSHNGSILVISTRSRKNKETLEGIREWSQRLDLAYVELVRSRKDPELHAKMFCDGMVQMQSELMVCLVNERRKSYIKTWKVETYSLDFIKKIWKNKDQFKEFSDRLSILHKN